MLSEGLEPDLELPAGAVPAQAYDLHN